MRRRLALLAWFLGRPKLYRELARSLRRKLLGPRARATQAEVDEARQEATRWCQERALATSDALHLLTGEEPPGDFSALFREELQRAVTAAIRCPTPMGGPGNLDLIYHLAEHVKATRVIETGVAYGWSSLALMLSLRHRPGARLISTDLPYPMRGTDKYVGVVVPVELRVGWEILRRPDRDALTRCLATLPQIDMCHYDSDKSYEGRSWAYRELWNALRAGGVFISDDVGDNLAFREFCNSLGRAPVVVSTPAFMGMSDLRDLSGSRTEWTKYAGVLVK
jgi:predicted O-methyltransferase YrrM